MKSIFFCQSIDVKSIFNLLNSRVFISMAICIFIMLFLNFKFDSRIIHTRTSMYMQYAYVILLHYWILYIDSYCVYPSCYILVRTVNPSYNWITSAVCPQRRQWWRHWSVETKFILLIRLLSPIAVVIFEKLFNNIS